MRRRDFLKILSQAAAAGTAVPLLPAFAWALCPPQNFAVQGGAVVANGPTCSNTQANYFVAAGTSSFTFDGTKVLPGQIVELSAGTHGPRIIANLQGTATKPIIVRGSPTGQVTVRRSTAASGSFVFELRNCRHVILDGGYFKSSTYGIKVTYASSGIDAPSAFIKIGDSSTGVANGTPTSFITLRNIEIDGGWLYNNSASKSTDGIGISWNDHVNFKYSAHPTKWHENLLIERCYVHNVEGEGLYLGPNWRNGTEDDLPCRNLEVRYNLIENCGWDAMNPKSWVEGKNNIHHNICRNSGMAVNDGHDSQSSGIAVGCSTVNIYNNWVENSGPHGISSYVYQMPAETGFGPFESRVYNNVVINGHTKSGELPKGITVGGDSTSVKMRGFIYNNTVVNYPAGINLSSSTLSGSTIANNILADSGTISAPNSASIVTNRIGSTSSMGFVDAAAKNFHLKSTSPARNAATGTYVATTDYDDVARPKDGAADQGAFES